MLKEIIQLTQSLLEDETFSNLGMVPKEGLHIILKLESQEENIKIAEDAEYVFFTEKTKEISPLHLKCAQWWKYSTMLGTVDTYKVFDVPAKAIHTISPFCVGLKRTNLEGGDQFLDNFSKSKSQVYERISGYFTKAKDLLESDEDKSICEIFKTALNDKSRLHTWLNNSGKFNEVKDNEYIVFYLDLPIEKYKTANQKYLKEKLFNTVEFNLNDTKNPELVYGTSNWLNSFSGKKPFLKHQSGTFDIGGRISSLDAQVLQEFSGLSRRKLLPNPLPIFIMQDELATKAIKIFKEDATSGDDQRKGYLAIIEELIKEFKEDIGNYYLLFMSSKGEIKDFDFVSHFQYFLNTDRSPWQVEDLFGTGAMQLHTIKDLLVFVLPDLFNNTLVVRARNKSWSYRWFEDINPAYCKSPNAYILVMKYRKAFYDFIYKSKRRSVSVANILDILMTGIKDDIRCDEYKNKQHTEGFNIRMKLNLLFNLHQYFSIKPNKIFMPSTIGELQDHIEVVARGEAHLETNEQFAFAAGQVIARIFWESETGDSSFRYLEPFLAQSKPDRFKLSISNLFKRYKHGIYSERFRNVSSEVMTFDLKDDLQKLHPHILAGVFSKNQLFGKEKQETKLTESN